MRAFALLMLGSFLVLVFPWIVALYRRQYSISGALFAVWLGGYICAAFLWFGVGIAIVIGSGVLVTLLTSLHLDSNSVSTRKR